MGFQQLHAERLHRCTHPAGRGRVGSTSSFFPPPPLLPVYRQHMPPCALPRPVLCYEELLDAQLTQLPSFRWKDVDEEAACGLCYTSGTTGNPKGVL